MLDIFTYYVYVGDAGTGVLISGGYPLSSIGTKVELFNLKTKTSCSLPDLPEGRRYPTSEGGVICGGLDSTQVQTSCMELLENGTWSSSKYEPIRPRYHHISWNKNPRQSFMLLGGDNGQNRRTSDIVHANGTVEEGFPLQFDVL